MDEETEAPVDDLEAVDEDDASLGDAAKEVTGQTGNVCTAGCV